jgi:putative chitinase
MPTLPPPTAAPGPATATPQPKPTTAPATAPTSPPPAQPTAVPAPAAATPGKHTVKPGEWLYSIGRLYNVNPFTLAQVNGISAPYRIYPGQQLTIPGGQTGPTPVPGTCPSPYTVQAGETIFSIARKCGKTPSAIITANSLVNPNLIFVGQKLQIP